MAATPKLVIALEARLDKFEKDLQRAGVIAEKAAGNIEKKLSAVGPSGGGALKGGLIGGIGYKAAEDMIDFIKGVNEQIVKVGTGAKLANVDLDKFQDILFATMKGGSSRGGALESLEALSLMLVDKENSLTEFLDVNNIKYNERMKVEEAIVKIAELAEGRSAAEIANLADKLGLQRDFVESLSKGTDIYQQNLELAGEINQRLSAETIKSAKDFRDNWNNATNDIATYMQSRLGSVMAQAAQGGKFLWNKFLEGVGPDALKKYGFGDMTTNQSAYKELVRTGPDAMVPLGTTGGGPGGDLSTGLKFPKKEKSGGADTDKFQSALEQMEKREALIKADTETVGMNTEVRERARAEASLMEAAQVANTRAGKANTEATAEQIEKIKAQGAAMEEAARKLRLAEEAFSSFKEVSSGLGEAFKGMVLEGKKLDEVMKNLLSRLAGRSIDKLFDLLATNAWAGVGGAAGIGSLFGRRAAGGPVSSGRSYIVGEHGAELFAPSISGRIIPPGRAAGGGGANVNVHNYGLPAEAAMSRNSNGDIDVILRPLAAGLANQMRGGRGPLGRQLTAVRNGRDLRG